MKIIYNDDLYGEVTYSNTYDAWKKTTPYLFTFNNKECPVTLYIDLSSLYMKTKYGITKYFTMDTLSSEEIEMGKRWEQQQREFYHKYLEEPQDIARQVEEEIIADFQERWSSDVLDYETCVKFFGEKGAKKIVKADTREKILSLVKIKSITIKHNSILILGKSEWYPYFGAKISSDGFITVGMEVK